jgi:hypothetical protein
MHRRAAMGVRCVDVGTGGQQLLDQRHVALRGGGVQAGVLGKFRRGWRNLRP